MKIRHQFVSNSSSTSFIVKGSDKAKAEAVGLHLISVGYLKNQLKKLQGFYWLVDVSNALFRLDKLSDYDYITNPFDRDIAYERGIDQEYVEFEGDI